MISSCRPAGPIVSTVFTSVSLQGMPTSRSLILRQVGAARAGVKVVGGTVTPPASALLPASGVMMVDPPPVPVLDEPPAPVFEDPPVPMTGEPPAPVVDEPPAPGDPPVPGPLFPPDPMAEPPAPVLEGPSPPDPGPLAPPEPVSPLSPIFPVQPYPREATSRNTKPARRKWLVNMFSPGDSSRDAQDFGRRKKRGRWSESMRATL